MLLSLSLSNNRGRQVKERKKSRYVVKYHGWNGVSGPGFVLPAWASAARLEKITVILTGRVNPRCASLSLQGGKGADFHIRGRKPPRHQLLSLNISSDLSLSLAALLSPSINLLFRPDDKLSLGLQFPHNLLSIHLVSFFFFFLRIQCNNQHKPRILAYY